MNELEGEADASLARAIVIALGHALRPGCPLLPLRFAAETAVRRCWLATAMRLLPLLAGALARPSGGPPERPPLLIFTAVAADSPAMVQEARCLSLLSLRPRIDSALLCGCAPLCMHAVSRALPAGLPERTAARGLPQVLYAGGPDFLFGGPVSRGHAGTTPLHEARVAHPSQAAASRAEGSVARAAATELDLN